MSETTGSADNNGQKVMIAMDGSEYSAYALDFYAESLHRPGNKVFVVHVSDFRCISSPAVALMTVNTEMTMVTKEIKEEEERASQLVQALTEKMKGLGIDGSVACTHGEPGPAIITLSHEKNANYIVVGCRGKGLMRKTLTGSVTDYLTNHSHVPVVVARHKDHLQHHRCSRGSKDLTEVSVYADCLRLPKNNVVVVHVSNVRCISNPAVALMSGNLDMSLVTKEIKEEEDRASELVKTLTEKKKGLGYTAVLPVLT